MILQVITWSMYTFLLQVFGDCRGVVYTLNPGGDKVFQLENYLWNTDPVIPLKILVGGFKHSLFSTLIWGNDPIWRYNTFQMGCWNHQLEMLSIACIPCFGKMWKHLAGSPIQVQIIDPMMASLNWCQFNEIHLQNQLNQCLGILAFRLVFNCVASLLAISPWLGGGWKIRLLAFVSAHPQLREDYLVHIDNTSNNTKLPFWKEFLCTSIFSPFAVFDKFHMKYVSRYCFETIILHLGGFNSNMCLYLSFTI